MVALLAMIGSGFSLPVSGQAPPGSPSSVVGTVINLDSSGRVIRVKNDRGQEVLIGLQPSVSFRRVAPGESDLKNASTITFGDIAIGDRILARGSAGTQTFAATLIVLVSQSDMANKQAAESSDWDKRGIAGLVTATSADTLTAKVRGGSGTQSIVIALTSEARVRRYAPDSVRFTDAQPSSLEQIHIGDQVRARGDRNEDGSRILAVEIVAGTFKSIAGLILDVNSGKGEIQIRDLDSKQPVIVRINSDSKLQKIPPQGAQQLAARLRPGRGNGVTAAEGGDPQQILDGSPAITLADLKNGDAVVVSSTVGATAGQITAISLMAGVEPILRKPNGGVVAAVAAVGGCRSEANNLADSKVYGHLAGAATVVPRH
jgi:hypothetical protein